jgi:hypothetical protein
VKQETLLGIALSYLGTVTELSESELRGYLSNWRMVPFMYRGELAGCGMMRDNELHFIMRPEYRGRACQRDAIHAFLQPLVAAHGGLVTRVPLGHTESMKFVTKIGFVETHRSGTFIFFSLASDRFGRKG